MHSKIDHLDPEEKQLVYDAPILVTALIAGSDGVFRKGEIKTAVKIIHVKSYAAAKNVRGIYKDIDVHSEEKIQELIDSLPEEILERTDVLSKRLAGLNAIMPKLDYPVAIDLYNSLKEMAYYVGHANETALGIGYHKNLEKDLAELSMIVKPEQPSY